VFHKSKVVADYYAKAWHHGGTLAHAAQVTQKKKMRKVVSRLLCQSIGRAGGTVVHAAIKAQEGSIKALFQP
jgi:hypothetical protein